MNTFYVYVITDATKVFFYIGVTNNLKKRLAQHFKNKGTENLWAGKRNCYQLIYFEEFQFINNAIKREKQLKGWSRVKKEKLIKKTNPKLRVLKIF
jgi:putative endonuclease